MLTPNVIPISPLVTSLPELAEPVSGSFLEEAYLVTRIGLIRSIRTPWLRALVPAALSPVPLPFGGFPPRVTELPKPYIHLLLDLPLLYPLITKFLQFAKAHASVECQQDFVLIGKCPTAYADPLLSDSDTSVDHSAPAVPLGHWVLDIHSHGRIPAYFSSTDNVDDQHDRKIAMVIGRVDTDHPTYSARVGVGQGMFFPLDLEQAFPEFSLYHETGLSPEATGGAHVA